MEPGVLALVGIFALAAILALWNFSYVRSIERRLAAHGFQPCDDEAPSLEKTWRALTGCDASQELSFSRCRRRGSGRSALHHFTVNERPAAAQRTSDTPTTGATYPAYLFDLPDSKPLSHGAVTLHVLPPGSKLLRKALAGLIALSDSRPRLEVGAYPWSPSIVAAHGDKAGKLDDFLSQAVQEKLARAATHGFFIIHLANGKAAFAALSSHRDINRQMTYLAEWV